MTKIVLDMNRHGILSRGGSIRQSEITDKDRAVNGGIEDISQAAVPGNRFTDIYSCSVWLWEETMNDQYEGDGGTNACDREYSVHFQDTTAYC